MSSVPVLGYAQRQTVEYLRCLRFLSFEHRMNKTGEKTESEQRFAAQLSLPVCLALGVGIGTSLGVAMGNLALGVAIGTTVGVGIGAALSVVGYRSRASKGAPEHEEA